MEYLTYSKFNGFNIVEANNEEEAETSDDIFVLDELSEVDSQIVSRLRELLED